MTHTLVLSPATSPRVFVLCTNLVPVGHLNTFSAEDPFIGGDNLTERGDHSDPWPPTVQLHLTFENTQWAKVNAQWRKVKIHSGES